MKSVYAAIGTLIIGMCIANFLPVTALISMAGGEFLLQDYYLLPAFFLLLFIAAKGVHHIATYTDEFLPFQLCLLAFVLAILGLWFWMRLLILGTICLIAAAFWSRRTVKQYFV